MPESRVQTFWAWMMVVDAEAIRLSGLSIHDLADRPFHDWFDAGMTAKKAARRTLEEEGYPFQEATSEYL